MGTLTGSCGSRWPSCRNLGALTGARSSSSSAVCRSLLRGAGRAGPGKHLKRDDRLTRRLNHHGLNCWAVGAAGDPWPGHGPPRPQPIASARGGHPDGFSHGRSRPRCFLLSGFAAGTAGRHPTTWPPTSRAWPAHGRCSGRGPNAVAASAPRDPRTAPGYRRIPDFNGRCRSGATVATAIGVTGILSPGFVSWRALQKGLPSARSGLPKRPARRRIRREPAGPAETVRSSRCSPRRRSSGNCRGPRFLLDVIGTRAPTLIALVER